MDKRTFCPFVNGDCVRECMFFTIGGTHGHDNVTRNCIIAKALLELPDSEHQENALNTVLAALHNP
ncbi:MAG: hypothetical protein NC337_09365 [Roseburia sp.]|nr:hypothetical protein [Roseburia sp.]